MGHERHAGNPQSLLEEAARVRVGIEAGENAGYQFKTHPNIDKALYAREALLGLKDPERPFPTGDPVGILKWRMQACDYISRCSSLVLKYSS